MELLSEKEKLVSEGGKEKQHLIKPLADMLTACHSVNEQSHDTEHNISENNLCDTVNCDNRIQDRDVSTGHVDLSKKGTNSECTTATTSNGQTELRDSSMCPALAKLCSSEIVEGRHSEGGSDHGEDAQNTHPSCELLKKGSINPQIASVSACTKNGHPSSNPVYQSSDGRRELLLPASAPNPSEPGSGTHDDVSHGSEQNSSECNRNTEILSALLKPEPTLARSDSLKTVVNTMVEVGMWMPLGESNGIPFVAKNQAGNTEKTHPVNGDSVSRENKKSSQLTSVGKDCFKCSSEASPLSGNVEVNSSASYSTVAAAVTCQSGNVGSASSPSGNDVKDCTGSSSDDSCLDPSLDGQSSCHSAVKDALECDAELAGLEPNCAASPASDGTATGIDLGSVITTVIRERPRSSPIVIWKAESDLDKSVHADNATSDLLVMSHSNSKNDAREQSAEVGKDDDGRPESLASLEAKSGDSVDGNDLSGNSLSLSTTDSRHTQKSPLVTSEDKESDVNSAVTPLVITPEDLDSPDDTHTCHPEGSLTPATTSCSSLPQICQVFGGMTGSKLQQLHKQGSITLTNQKSKPVKQQHSLLKSILRSANMAGVRQDTSGEKVVRAQREGGLSGSEVITSESGEMQTSGSVFVKQEKPDTDYKDAACETTSDEQVVKYVTYQNIQPHPDNVKGSSTGNILLQATNTHDATAGKKPVTSVVSKPSSKSILPQQTKMTSLLQNQGKNATTLLLPKSMLTGVGGVVGKVSANGNNKIQIAVPVLVSKAGNQVIGQPPVLFTFATLPKSSAVDCGAGVSVAAAPRPVTTSASVAKPVTSNKPKSVTPKLAAVTDLDNDYNRYLKNIVKLKATVKSLKDTDIMYTCPMPPSSLFLSHKMNRMFVCRGCNSTFHKQSSLSEHQLRRTMSLKYSCESDCHVLFYNVCQLILHTRTHPPMRQDWQKKVEISGLPEDLLYKAGGATKGETYAEIKKAVYAKAGMKLKKQGDEKTLDEMSICSNESQGSELVSGRPEKKRGQKSRNQKLNCSEEVRADHAYGRLEKKKLGRNGKGKSNQASVKGAIRAEQRVNTLLNGNPVICTECGSMFKKPSDLMMHMISYGSSDTLCLCKTCPVILRSKCAQSAHARIHKNSVPYVCPECGQVIHGSHNVFWKHLHVKCAHHIRQVLFQCQFCQKQFRDQKRLVLHTTNQHSTKFHKCQLCPMAFKMADCLTQHAKANHNGKVSQKTIYKCPFCVAVYRDDTYASHIEQHLSEVPLKVVYRCNACSKSFEKRSLCIAHMTQVHKFYFNHNQMCHICGADFKLASSLLQHQLAEHQNIADLDDALTRCLRHSGVISTDRSASLASPTSAISPDGDGDDDDNDAAAAADDDDDDNKDDNSGNQQSSDRPLTVLDIKEEPTDEDEDGDGGEGGEKFHCARCQMTMASARLYHQHMAKHKFLEKKRFLGQPGDVKSHGIKRLADSSNDLVLKIKLPKLTGASKNSDGSKETKTLFTKQVPGAPDPEPLYYCSECSRAFYLEEGLATHLKKEHNQDRQFPCHLCGKTYKDQSALKFHVKKLHEGWSREKPYVCWICQEKDTRRNFPKRIHLIRHISKEHKIARNLIDYSKIPSLVDCAKAEASPGQMSPNIVDGEQDVLSDKLSDVDVPPVKRLKLEGETSFSCAKCSFVSEDRATFVSHIKKHQPLKLSDAKLCLECGLSFTVLQSLKRHLLVVHQIRDFDRYSEESGLDLVSQPEEQEVMMPKTTANPQPDKICRPRGFVDGKPYVYKRSQKEDENDLECKVCYKSYDDELELRAHMRTHGMAYIKSSRRQDDV